MHPYKMHQALLPADHPRRLAYCRWFVNNLMNDDLLNLTFFLTKRGSTFRDTSILKICECGALITRMFLLKRHCMLRKLVFGWQFLAGELDQFFVNFTVNAERHRNNFLAEF